MDSNLGSQMTVLRTDALSVDMIFSFTAPYKGSSMCLLQDEQPQGFACSVLNYLSTLKGTSENTRESASKAKNPNANMIYDG